MKHTLLLFSVLSLALGCVGVDDALEDDSGAAAFALEGTREGHGVLRLLNDGDAATFAFLDDEVALNRRAALNLVAHRDGGDGVFGTRDDDLFDSIAEVDAVRYVGPSALNTLVGFASESDYLPSDDTTLGTYDGITFSFAQAERVLAYVNRASDDAMMEASIPSRAIASILAARPVLTMPHLASLYWVGPRTLERLVAASEVASDDTRDDCRNSDDCGPEQRCEGKPSGFEFGKCRDIGNIAGVQEDCDVDRDCNNGLICIAQSVYGQGYCNYGWMRDHFEVVLDAEVPRVSTEPLIFPLTVYGQASVPEDLAFDVIIEHDDPSALFIRVQPPTGQEAVTLWDGAAMTGPLPTHFINHSIYRDDAVNGEYQLLVQNLGGRGEGTVRRFGIHVSSRWD